ncbi:ABC transporter permease [Solibacillus daqui]|uniref:ABC transporter permease n=1 Tax=Solibacillus daqui TaxID=2912187 RepID=UPI00236697B9|nr:ABC transporter permease [Solibacillus daqui]
MFVKRLYRSYQFNFKLFKSVFDWTVVLYIAIPSVVISFFLYRDISANFQAIEIQYNILLTLLFGLSFFLIIPSLRLFLYDADLLFYKQQATKIRHIKLYGYCYSFLRYNCFLIIALLFASPFIILPLSKIILVFNIVSVLHIFIHYKYQKWYTKWPLFLVIHALFTFTLFIIPIWGYSILLVIVHVILLKAVFSNRYWTIEVRWEYEAFYQWMKRFYQFSKEMRYYLPAKTKQPLVLLAKKTVFSKYRIDNLFYKTLLRKLHYMISPLQLIAICSGLSLVLPMWAKVLVFVFSIIGLHVLLRSIIGEIKQAPFFQLMTVHEDEWLNATSRLRNRLLTPTIVIMAVLFFIL